MREALPRRGFLAGLAGLPLIGGSVALIGQPTAAAVAQTPDLLDSYDTWLSLERNFLRFERFGNTEGLPLMGCEVVYRDRRTGEVYDAVRFANAGSRYLTRRGSAADRAAVILSAAGVPLTGSRADV